MIANRDIQRLTRDLPSGTGAEDAQTPGMAIHLVRCELDLIEEGQEAAENYTPAQVRKIRAWLKKWEAAWMLVRNSDQQVLRTFASEQEAVDYVNHDSMYRGTKYSIKHIASST